MTHPTHDDKPKRSILGNAIFGSMGDPSYLTDSHDDKEVEQILDRFKQSDPKPLGTGVIKNEAVNQYREEKARIKQEAIAAIYSLKEKWEREARLDELRIQEPLFGIYNRDRIAELKKEKNG